MKKIKIFPVRLVTMLLFVFALAFAADAATFTVNSTAETADVNTIDNICADDSGNCTLRAAIQQANATAGDDAIIFDATVFAAQQTIFVQDFTLPQITENLTITGTSPVLLTIDGAENNRIFNIAATAVVSISNLTVANAYVGEASGAGILNLGNLTLTNVDVRNNTVILGVGGGIYNGGGILNISNSFIYENSAGSNSSGGGIANLEGTVSITDSTVLRNFSAENGGGILSSGGTFTITSSTVRNNEAGGNGGGIAILGGTLNINRSTVGSPTEGGSNRAANGGGIYSENSTVNLTNSTISENFAGNIGGGFYGFAGLGLNSLNANSSTIAFNTALNGGGIAVSSITGLNSVATLSNTIISDNNAATGADISDNNAIDAIGTIVSTGYNIIENTTGATVIPVTGDQFNVDPLLLPLADNGGATRTHALSNSPGAVSPAIDQGNSGETTDQRGFARPVDNPSIPPATLGNNSDIGAFEVLATTAAPIYIKGRVISETGRGISRVSVTLIENDGTRRLATTNQFGYFRFENVSVGQTVTISAGSKKSRFSPIALTLNENIQDLTLTIQH